MPYIPNLYGFSCDNIESVEVRSRFTADIHTLTFLKLVLANSTLVRASATENPDLFSALKGGGPNFGLHNF